MWWKEYRDYPLDKPLIKYQVQPGKGIIGCEMHEINGWGNTIFREHPKHRISEKKERLND
jgi:hypothetical protein